MSTESRRSGRSDVQKYVSARLPSLSALTAVLACVQILAVACHAAETLDRTALTPGRDDAAAPVAAVAAVGDGGSSNAARAILDGSVATPVGSLPPLAFGTRPDRTGLLSVAVEGPCGPNLDVTVEADRTRVSWGLGVATMATIDEHGVHDVMAVPNVNAPMVLLGHFPDHAWYIHDEGYRCVETHQLRKWTNGQWKDIQLSPLKDHPGDLLAFAQVGDGLLYSETDSNRCGSDAVDRTRLVGDGTKVPQIADDGATITELAGFPTGEIFAIADGTRKTEVRVVSAGGNVQKKAIASGSHLTALAPDDAFVTTDSERMTVMHFDGQGWSPWPLPLGAQSVTSFARAPDRSLWVVTDKGVLRQDAAGAWTDTRAPGKTRSLAGVPEGAPWIVRTDGTVARYESADWTLVPLPTPLFAENARFSASKIIVRDARDVWIEAAYHERNAAWGKGLEEIHSALLRTIPPDETLRCGGSVQKIDTTATVEWGFESWPRAATDDCATPLVLLTDHTPLDPPTDFPRSRALLAKHPEFDGAVYEEIAAGQHLYFAAKTPDVQMARALLAFYAKKTFGAMPRIVCADPAPLRTFEVAK